QLPDPGDVPDRPHPLARTQASVDRDAVAVRLDADGLQADALDARPTAGRDEQALAAQLAPVVELQDIVGAVAPGAGRVRAQDQLDAVATQDLAERFAQRRGLAGEQVLGALDDHDLAAEAAHGLRHLHADGPAAEDEQAARDRRHARHLTVGPHAVELTQ